MTLSGAVEIGVYKAVNKTAVIGTDRNSFTNLTFAASEDLGGGLKAGFMAQMRFNPANGGQSSSSYGYPFEQVKTSLSGGFGSVDLGKFSTAVQTGWIRPFGDDSSLTAYTGTATTRSASQIAYNTPAISGFKAQIVKIQGDSAAADVYNDGTQTTVMYDANNIKAYVSISKKLNGVGTADSVTGVPAFTTAQTDTTEYGASYNFGIARVALGQTKSELSAGTGAEKTETGFALEVPVNKALSIGFGYGKTSTSDNTSTDGQDKVALVANYSLSKRTTLLAKYLKVSGNVNDTTLNGNGTFLGLSHTF